MRTYIAIDSGPQISNPVFHIALAVRQAEETLLKQRVAPVRKGSQTVPDAKLI
jgi:hypothetical protein